jgi:glycosyltransferase involved in cell wall biosynthesis
LIKLGVDATSVAPAGKGIARVQRGTVGALMDSGRYELVVFARHPEELPEVAAVQVTMRPTLIWEQVGLARAFRRHRLDAMLTWTERLPVIGRGRYAVWLFEPPTHRIAQNVRSGASGWQRGSDLVTRLLWRRSLRRAAVVLTGSRATADAIRDVAQAQPLYPGLDERFAPGADRDDFVLHVGSDDPRDDTQTAIAAAQRAGESLVVVGNYAGPSDGAVVKGRVSDESLAEHYRRARAFLDTSLYEGFGYQVLEAMASGTPVVASDTTSIPELVGGAGLLCPPGDAAAFAGALRRLRDEPGLGDDLRTRGLQRAREFTWERTARELSSALEEALR